MLRVQIFGLKNSQATRAAERFFKERRIDLQLVDLKVKPLAPGELKRFLDRFTLQSLIDREGKSYVDAGLAHLRMTDPDLIRRIETDPALLRLPLVRAGSLVSIGRDEEAWKTMAAQAAKAG
ncbi:MAG: arsenate reductase [Bryobacterales bacterium]|nr:arsenate reductase [Bryobacterales bacterium]